MAKHRYPFQVHCTQCTAVLIVYALDQADADIKIAGKGWKRAPYRCVRCVAAFDGIRTTALLEPGT